MTSSKVIFFQAIASLGLGLSGFAAEVDFYLFGGQSNMQGIGKIARLGEEVPKGIPHAFYFNGKTFESLILGRTRTSTRAGEFGPEVGFALEIASPERSVYLVKDHHSGMGLHHGFDGGKWVGGGPAPSRRNFYPGTNAEDANQSLLYRLMLVATEELGLLPDTVHFNAAGQLALGRRFARALTGLLKSEQGRKR